MSLRRALVGAALLALVSALLMLVATPSQAERIGMVVGNHATGPFQANLSRPLFAGQGRLVPGERLESTFYLKNNSPTPARAILTVLPGDTLDGLEKWLTFDVSMDGGASTAGPSARAGECSLLAEGVDFVPGEVRAVDVAMEMPDVAGQQGMGKRVAVDFVVTMSEVAAAGSDGCGDGVKPSPGEPSPGQPAPELPLPGQPAGNAAGPVPDCTRDVVVSMVGQPTCVPSAVDAGVRDHGHRPVRDAGLFPALAALLVGGGVGLVLGARRRRDQQPA